MSAELLESLEDGSRISIDRESGALIAEGAGAEVLAACVERIVELPPDQGAAWLWGEAEAGELSSHRTGGTQLILSSGTGSATVDTEVLKRVLRSKLERLLAGETFWMFRRPPIASLANEGDRVYLAPLEPRLAAFEDAVRSRALDEATESARRKLIYAELEEGGLFDEALLVEKLYWLRKFAFPTLAKAASSALELWAYYRGPERKQIVGRPPPARLGAGALALDWANTAVPPGFEKFRWWALAERTFLGFPDQPLSRGTVYLSQGSFSARLLRRSEDGARATLYDAVWA